jgi:hypothetical protein
MAVAILDPAVDRVWVPHLVVINGEDGIDINIGLLLTLYWNRCHHGPCRLLLWMQLQSDHPGEVGSTTATLIYGPKEGTLSMLKLILKFRIGKFAVTGDPCIDVEWYLVITIVDACTICKPLRWLHVQTLSSILFSSPCRFQHTLAGLKLDLRKAPSCQDGAGISCYSSRGFQPFLELSLKRYLCSSV